MIHVTMASPDRRVVIAALISAFTLTVNAQVPSPVNPDRFEESGVLHNFDSKGRAGPFSVNDLNSVVLDCVVLQVHKDKTGKSWLHVYIGDVRPQGYPMGPSKPGNRALIGVEVTRGEPKQNVTLGTISQSSCNREMEVERSQDPLPYADPKQLYVTFTGHLIHGPACPARRFRCKPPF